jgi:hypothetical protein
MTTEKAFNRRERRGRGEMKRFLNQEYLCALCALCGELLFLKP